MKKTILTLFAGVMGMTGAFGAELTPDQALSRLASSSPKKAASMNASSARLLHTFHSADNKAMIYVFGKENNYFLLSADDAAVPMLGYADTYFDADNMPPQMKAWLAEYENQIEAARVNKAAVASSEMIGIDPSWTAIAPMVKTRWNQGAPYNALCPTSGGKSCYTGCVATAMAQAMKYWNYPEHGEGKISYSSGRLNKLLTLTLDDKIFEWDNMIDAYETGHYTQAQADAVALLMQCAGYGVSMNYSTEASGALSFNIPTALKNYFKYDGNCRLEYRNFYSISEWNAMVYDNLKNVGPIIYDGDSRGDGGHSFICDGYDGNGYFHFNWGWGGMSDGYFVLNALDPNALGIGGGGGGYNFAQDMVLGIQPPTGEPVKTTPAYLMQDGSLVASISSLTVTFSQDGPDFPFWMSYNYEPVKMKLGVIAEPIDGTEGETLYFETNVQEFEISDYGNGVYQKYPGGGSISPQIRLRNIKEGRYKLILASKNTLDANATWVPVRTYYGNYNYVILNRTGGTYTIENMTPAQMVVKSASVESDLYVGCLTQLKVEVENPTEFEIYKGLTPVVYVNGKMSYLGGNTVVTMDPKSSKTLQLITSFNQISGGNTVSSPTEVEIRFMDSDSQSVNQDYILKAEMSPNPGNPSLNLLAIGIDADRDGNVYQVKDKTQIPFNSKIRVTRGYFAYPLYAIVSDATGLVLYQQTIGGDATFISAGETLDIEDVLNFVDGEPNTPYRLNIAYKRSYSPVSIGASVDFVILGESGIDEAVSSTELSIFADPAGFVTVKSASGLANVNVSDVNGKQIKTYEAISDNSLILDLSENDSNIYIVRATDKEGNVKTMKIIR